MKVQVTATACSAPPADDQGHCWHDDPLAVTRGDVTSGRSTCCRCGHVLPWWTEPVPVQGHGPFLPKQLATIWTKVRQLTAHNCRGVE